MRLIAIPPYRNPAVNWGWVLRHLVEDYRKTGALESVEVDVDDGYLVESTSEKRDEEVLAIKLITEETTKWAELAYRRAVVSIFYIG